MAELLGEFSLKGDQDARKHRLRQVAEKVLTSLSDADQRILSAYTEGVNSGLHALSAVPFEYLYLGEPKDWSPVDSILVILSMAMDLQYENGSVEATLMVMKETLPEPLFQFLAPVGTSWDAPLMAGHWCRHLSPGQRWLTCILLPNRLTHPSKKWVLLTIKAFWRRVAIAGLLPVI